MINFMAIYKKIIYCLSYIKKPPKTKTMRYNKNVIKIIPYN